MQFDIPFFGYLTTKKVCIISENIYKHFGKGVFKLHNKNPLFEYYLNILGQLFENSYLFVFW